MRELVERGYFLLCLALGRLLRAARYSKAWKVDSGHVRKRRLPYAPLLIRISGPLIRLLDTGVRVLPQREWEERERVIYQSVYRASIQIDADGTLVLPRLPGQTLAALLEDQALDESRRQRAIESAVVALVQFHRLGFTHGDAMAENVLVDLEGGVARWFDFETVHEPSRPMAWRCADDVRALLVTCLARTVPERVAETFRLILDGYADEDVTRTLATRLTSSWRRSLSFHLAQAELPFQRFHEIARLLGKRLGE